MVKKLKTNIWHEKMCLVILSYRLIVIPIAHNTLVSTRYV